MEAMGGQGMELIDLQVMEHAENDINDKSESPEKNSLCIQSA